MTKQQAFKIVLEELKKVDLFTGKHDARFDGDLYMFGVQAVMEYISFVAGDDKFDEEFVKNLIKSEEKIYD